jgi:hypothetical protein
VKPQNHQLHQKICGGCSKAWRGLPPTVIS